MARMKDCRECKAGHIAPEDWDYANDGPYPIYTMRQQRKEHSYCGLRMGVGDFAMDHMVMRRRHGAWEYITTPIHKGGKRK